MKKFLFAILTLSMLTACTSGEKPPTYAELQQHQQITGTAAAEPETEASVSWLLNVRITTLPDSSISMTK